jgi:hypothetical protein
MPTIPQPNAQGIVKSLGFSFNFSNAFATTATAQGVPVNTSFSTLQASLGTSTDLYPTQATAWGRANQAYAEGGSGSLPAATTQGQWLSYNGTNWVAGGSGGVVKLGFFAGETSQAEEAIAIGENAGRTNQGNGTAFPAIAIGWNAGVTNQGGNSIAIGEAAGQTSQGDNCIAIGTAAGQTNQPANTIVLNASGGPLNAAAAGGMYVNPIRNDNANPNWLTYNAMSGEITFDTLLSTSLGASTDAASLTTSVWAYAKQAETNAQVGITWITNATTPNAVGEIGTSLDAASLATSLWAYTKQANTWIANAITPNAVGEIGAAADTASLTTSLWAYAKQAETDAQTGITDAGQAQTAASSVASIVGNSTDTPSLLTTAWAYAKQAEIDAQTGITTANRALTYNLTGTTMNSTITNRGTGIINAFPATTFTLATSITFNIPPNWSATDNVFLDAWVLYNFQASLNTFWGARYTTNTYATPIDILGSTTVIADALSFPTSAQVYIPVNLVIPPTHLTSGGTINISFYGYITTGSSYFSAAPVVAGRVGLALE